jgi:hypothetical protein
MVKCNGLGTQLVDSKSDSTAKAVFNLVVDLSLRSRKRDGKVAFVSHWRRLDSPTLSIHLATCPAVTGLLPSPTCPTVLRRVTTNERLHTGPATGMSVAWRVLSKRVDSPRLE